MGDDDNSDSSQSGSDGVNSNDMDGDLITRLLTSYFTWDTRPFTAMLRNMSRESPLMQRIMLSNICDWSAIENIFDELHTRLRYVLRISRVNWINWVKPLFRPFEDCLNTVPSESGFAPHWHRPVSQRINLICGRARVERFYDEDKQLFRTRIVRADLQQHPRRFHADPGHISAQYNDLYPSVQRTIYHVLQLQFVTKPIRDSMHFLKVQKPPTRQRDFGTCVGQHCIKLKISRDGFVYAMGRSINMACCTNCSVYGFANSTNHVEILSLCEMEETAYELYRNAQHLDKQIFLLRLFGIVLPKSGQLCYCIILSTEDSGALEKSIGRGDGKGNGRYLWSMFGPEIHHKKWRRFHTPLSCNSRFVRVNWRRMQMNEGLIRAARAHQVSSVLCQFKLNPNLPLYDTKKAFYRQCNRLRGAWKRHGYVNGDWKRGEGILAFCMDILHAELAVDTHCLKWESLYLMDYYLWIQHETQLIDKVRNHGSATWCPHPVSRESCVEHLQNHVFIPINFNKTSPTSSKVARSMLS